MKFLTFLCLIFLNFNLYSNTKFDLQSDSLFNFNLLVGTYTDTIHLLKFNDITGELKQNQQLTSFKNSSYLTVNKNKIYVALENKIGEIGEFDYNNKSRTIKFIKKMEVGGSYPCFIDINKEKKLLAVANYIGNKTGNWSMIELNYRGELVKKLYVVDEFSKINNGASHVHCIKFNQLNSSIISSNLGTDKLTTYKYFNDINKVPEIVDEISLTKNSGPRQFIFNNQNSKIAYSVNELSGIIDVFKITDNNKLIILQSIQSDTSNFDKKQSAEIQMSSDGKFLYNSNRTSSNDITIFKVNKENGLLNKIGSIKTGLHPRNFIISPSGKWFIVANKDSNNLEIFKRNIITGLLENINYKISITNPVCLKWVE